ncbi:MAG: glycosyltransferase family 9 protein [Muribaculaceae bacterium]|nr:glycosyltransferase family 9 protein [Muribaculaceae bacterium]
MGKKTEARNILITRFSALGDVALALPVVYDACRKNPGRNFVFLTRKLPAKLFIDHPENLTVVGIDTAAYKGVAGLRRLFRELMEKYAFDTYVDLHDVLRTSILRILARLGGLRVTKIHKGRREKKALTRNSAKKLVELLHSSDRYRDAFRRAGIEVSADFTPLFHTTPPAPALYAQATSPKKDGEKWLAVAPFAAHKGKIYPLSLMAEIIDHYTAIPGMKIFVFGAGDEEKQCIDALAKGRENVVNMAEKKIGIKGELALMSRCDSMLAMDSANMHLASLVGLRTVSVWGATHPFCGFYGIGQDRADAVQLDMVCRPCSVFGNKPCRRGDYHCLNGINPQLIISRIDAKPNSNAR